MLTTAFAAGQIIFIFFKSKLTKTNKKNDNLGYFQPLKLLQNDRETKQQYFHCTNYPETDCSSLVFSAVLCAVTAIKDLCIF